MVPSPEARLQEKKLPVDGYGWSGGVFRPASFTGFLLFFFALLGGTGAAASAAAGSGPSADLVLRHGQIYTVDAARSWAESLAVSGDRIVFVGADRDVDGNVIEFAIQYNDGYNETVNTFANSINTIAWWSSAGVSCSPASTTGTSIRSRGAWS